MAKGGGIVFQKSSTVGDANSIQKSRKSKREKRKGEGKEGKGQSKGPRVDASSKGGKGDGKGHGKRTRGYDSSKDLASTDDRGKQKRRKSGDPEPMRELGETKSSRKRKRSKEKNRDSAGKASSSFQTPNDWSKVIPKCLKKHMMEHISENPQGYQKNARCDKCGLMNLPKKKTFFFHCKICKFDLCPKCGKEMAEPRKPKANLGNVNVKGNGMGAGTQLTDAQRLERRQKNWVLPCGELLQESATARPPSQDTAAVTQWAEGVPL